MARDIHIDNLNASTADVVRPITFIELEYDSGTSRSHSGIGDILWGGHTWLGIGDLGSVDGIEETAELQVNGLTLTLSGLDAAVINKVMNEDYQGRAARVYVGWLDANFNLLADPELVFFGYMDTQTVTVGQSAQISITVENRLVDWDRPRVLRYNDETQQNRFFGDRGLEFISSAAERSIVWGQKDNS